MSEKRSPNIKSEYPVVVQFDMTVKTVDENGTPQPVKDISKQIQQADFSYQFGNIKDKNGRDLIYHRVGGTAIIRTANPASNYFPRLLQSGYVFWDRLIHEMYKEMYIKFNDTTDVKNGKRIDD